MTSEDEEWMDHVKRELFPKLANTSIVVSIVPIEGLDVKFCLELGASIMLDKPIVALVRPGTKTSKKLMMVADEIVECNLETQAGREAVQETLLKLLEKNR